MNLCKLAFIQVKWRARRPADTKQWWGPASLPAIYKSLVRMRISTT